MKYFIIKCSLFFLIIFVAGCGSSWSGKIIYLKDGNILIKPDTNSKIKNNKLLIYREETVTHPITNETLGKVKDNISEADVLMIMENIIIAYAQQPWFDMMKINDLAKQTKGSSKLLNGNIESIGQVEQIIDEDTLKIKILNNKNVEFGTIAVIKYTDIITDPETGDALAVVSEPVAYIKTLDNTGKAIYELFDKNLGWVEVGDPVVRLSGDLSNRTIIFQKLHEYTKDLLYRRNYIHALRYIDLGLYREAILELNEVSKFDPKYNDTYYLIGLCYLNLNKYEDAEKVFNDHLEMASDDPKVWIALAYANSKQNKLYDALICYQKAADLIKDNAKIWIDIGDIYRSLNDNENAKKAYEKALEIDSDDQEAIYEIGR